MWKEKGMAFQTEGPAHANRETEAEVISLESQQTLAIHSSKLGDVESPTCEKC